MKHKISVIVPVHNGQNDIIPCVESIVGQEESKGSHEEMSLEIILINDGSTDQTGENCRRLQERYPQIQVITLDDKGVSWGRNAGLAKAAGDFITFVDADDRLLPGMLSHLLEVAERTGSDIAGCGFVSWHQEEEYKRMAAMMQGGETKSKEGFGERSYSGMAFIEKGILNKDTRCWSKLYRRESLGDVTFQEGLSIGEDMLFLLDVSSGADKITISDYPGYGYFQNPTGAMNRPFQESYLDQIFCWKRAADKISKWRPDLRYKAAGILLVSIMLTVGKIAELSQELQKKYGNHLLLCRQELKEALKVPGAFESLDGGYRIKVRVFERLPGIYVRAYHWRKKYRKG